MKQMAFAQRAQHHYMLLKIIRNVSSILLVLIQTLAGEHVFVAQMEPLVLILEVYDVQSVRLDHEQRQLLALNAVQGNSVALYHPNATYGPFFVLLSLDNLTFDVVR
jgi:hypothetical protein